MSSLLQHPASSRSAWLPVLVAVGLTAGDLGAQEPESAQGSGQAEAVVGERQSLRMPDRVQFLTTAAFRSPQQGWLGQTPGRDVFVGVIRTSWRVGGSERATFGYFAEFIPIAVVTSNPRDVRPLDDCAEDHPQWKDKGSVPAIEYFETCVVRSVSAYGVGITPLGLSARFARATGMALVTDFSVSAIMFDRNMPYPTAAKLNYKVTVGTSLEIPVASRSFVSLGYELHHLSNGGRGDFNPGIASHAIQVGWGRRAR